MGLQWGHTVFSRILGIGVEVITHRCFALSQVVCLYCQQAGGVSRQQNAENQASMGLEKLAVCMPFKSNSTAQAQPEGTKKACAPARIGGKCFVQPFIMLFFQ
jgi:hypothetical protein